MESQMDQILKRHFAQHPLSEQRILLDKFPDLDFTHLEAAYAVGHDLFQQHKYEDAEKIFYCLATMNHFEVRYWKALAVTLFVEKKYAEAVGIYLAAYFLNPMDIEVTSAMADCCMAMGDADGTREFLNQTCELFKEVGERPDLANRAKGLLEMMGKGEKHNEER